MKKRLQGIIAGFLAGALMTGGIVFAKDISETAQLYYRNIKIFIDGAEIVPKGSDGSVVEPFIMNGATYLPVRAISEALGKDVAWDGKTYSVYIGKKDQLQPDNYLDRIQYNNYQEAEGSSKFSILYGNQTLSDCNDKVYTNGILFDIYGGSKMEDGFRAMVGYPLNSQYRKLTGNIVLPKDKDVTESEVYIYGDGELLYKAIGLSYSMPFKFDIDVRGVNELEIKVKTSNGSYSRSNIALTDLALYE